MQYKFTNIQLKSGITPATATTHANEPFEYLQVELTFAEKGLRNPTQKPRDYIFDKEIIDNMRPYLVPDPQDQKVKRLNVQQYEAAVAAGTIEDMRFVKNAFREQVVLQQPYVRRNADGTPRMNRDGVIVPITSMVVTVYRYLDPDDGQMHDVETKEQIAQRILNARYMPWGPQPAAPAQPAQPAAQAPIDVAAQTAAMQQQVANLGI